MHIGITLKKRSPALYIFKHIFIYTYILKHYTTRKNTLTGVTVVFCRAILYGATTGVRPWALGRLTRKHIRTEIAYKWGRDFIPDDIFYISGRLGNEGTVWEFGRITAFEKWEDGAAKEFFLNFSTICSKRVDKHRIMIYNVNRPNKEDLFSMATNLMQTSKKLIQALNSKGRKLTFSTKQFMGREGQPHNMYSISEAIWNEEKRRYTHSEVYSTTSMVRVTLFLRDEWYKVNGWELPTDQAIWNTAREELQKDG